MHQSEARAYPAVVMEIVVWLIASTFALNALMLGTSVALTSRGRHRARREIRQLEALWRLDPSPASRLRNRRRIALTLTAAIAWAGVAIAIPEPGRLVSSALGAVIPMLLGEETANDRADGIRNETTTSGRSVGDLADLASRDATTPDDPVGPSATEGALDDQTSPAFVAAQPRSSSVISLRWGEVAEAAGYGVERSPDGTTAWVTLATLGDGVTSYADAGLTPDMTYYYRVQATLQDGTAVLSDVVSATTPVSAPDPTVLSVTSHSRSTIGLAWDDVAGETGYRIERSADGETGWVSIGTTGQDVAEYTDTGLDPSTTYFYRVIAINDGGASVASNVVSETTKPGAGVGGGTGSDEDPEDDEPSPSPEPPVIDL